MKLQCVVSCLALAFSTVAGSAQVGLYINPIATRVSNSQVDPNPDPFGFLGANTTERTFWGPSIGGYYEFFHGDKADVAVDIRDSIVHGNGASLNSFLVGARVSGKANKTAFVPYAQLSGGIGTSKAPTSPIRLNRGTFDISGGLDYRFSSHVDFRAIEIGYGTVSTVSSGNFGGATSLGASRLLNFSTGLVFRIPVPGVVDSSQR